MDAAFVRWSKAGTNVVGLVTASTSRESTKSVSIHRVTMSRVADPLRSCKFCQIYPYENLNVGKRTGRATRGSRHVTHCKANSCRALLICSDPSVTMEVRDSARFSAILRHVSNARSTLPRIRFNSASCRGIFSAVVFGAGSSKVPIAVEVRRSVVDNLIDSSNAPSGFIQGEIKRKGK